MKVAIYCRVSTRDQTIEQQKAPLIQRCTEKGWQYEVYEEKVSGAKASRTELDRMMQAIRSRQFNAVMVYKLDRLGRSTIHLMQTIEELNNRGVQLICLNPDLDTKSANGRFFITVLAAVAELEREFIRERTQAKLDYLKANNVKLGRPTGSKDARPRRKSGYLLRYANK